MENCKKGYNYELQILGHIKSILGKEAYLWSQIPIHILVKYKILNCDYKISSLKPGICNPLPDTGIDIIQIDDDSNLTFIQCKNGYKKGLKLQDLSGFYAWKSHYPNYKGVVYYTDKLSRNIKQLQSNPNIEFIQLKASTLDENSTQTNITGIVMEKIVNKKDQIIEKEQIIKIENIDCKCKYCNTSLLKKYVFPEKNPVLYKNKDTKHKQIKVIKQKKIKDKKNKKKIEENLLEKEYKCRYCNNIFTNAPNLSRHINHYCRFVPDEIKSKLVEKQIKRRNNKI